MSARAAQTPDEVRGADGKTYRPARSPVAEAMEQAIADATDRATDHRVPVPGEADAVASVADDPGGPDTPSDEESAGPEPEPATGSGPPRDPGSGAPSLVPDPDLDQWREEFRFALSVARTVMDRPAAEVAEYATTEQLEELLRLVTDLGVYSDDVAKHL